MADISEQGVRGNWDYKLKPVCVICVQDFCNEDSPPGASVRQVALAYVQTGKVFSDQLVFYCIEMPKFRLLGTDFKSRLEQWCYLFNNIQSLSKVPEIFQKDSVFCRVFEIAEFSKLTKEEMNQMMLEWKDHWDAYSIDRWRDKQATERGMKRGMEKGMEKACLQEMLKLPRL